jgi:hypothetical protein
VVVNRRKSTSAASQAYGNNVANDVAVNIRQREVREQLIHQTPRDCSRWARTINKPAKPHSFTMSTVCCQVQELRTTPCSMPPETSACYSTCYGRPFVILDEVMDWLVFYNSKTLDYVSPMVFEEQWGAAQN